MKRMKRRPSVIALQDISKENEVAASWQDLGRPQLDIRLMQNDLRQELWALVNNDPQEMLALIMDIKRAFPFMSQASIVRFLNAEGRIANKTYFLLRNYLEGCIKD